MNTRSCRSLPRLLSLFAATAALGSCGGEESTAPQPTDVLAHPALANRPDWLPGVTEHDFGTIRHGAVSTTTLVIDVPEPDPQRGRWVPLAYQRSCTCARHEFYLVAADGSERIATGQGFSQYAVKEGERLEVRLTLMTGETEATDLPRTTVDGYVILQTEREPYIRRAKRVLFHYAIDCPIQVRPTAHVNFDKMAPSVRFARELELRGDSGRVTFSSPTLLERDPVQPGAFRPPRDMSVSLRPGDDDTTIVRLEFKPAPSRPRGPFEMSLTIDTDLEDAYVVRIPVSGRIIPDVELGAPGSFAFGQMDFTQPPREQMLLVTDHDVSRDAGFYVRGIFDRDGRDLAEHFEVRMNPTEHPRRTELVLVYTGGLTGKWLRGTVELAKEPDGPAVQSIPMIGFHRARN